MKRAVIQVPASTSNLGSGFDTLGLAVSLSTQLEMEVRDGPAVELISKGPNEFAELIEAAVEAFFDFAGTPAFGVRVAVSGDVPIARGLGYSATVRVGVAAALNEISGSGLSRQQLLEIVTRLEGHPDNASPSIFGGFTVSGMVQEQVQCLRFDVSSGLKLVTLAPSFPVSTEAARKLMPSSYAKADAAHALNRSALITAAFASGNFEALRGVFDDRFHQPVREKLIPQLSAVIRAGETAGALGGFLSGSGSAIICLTTKKEQTVAEAMREVLPDSEVFVLSVDNSGYRVI